MYYGSKRVEGVSQSSPSTIEVYEQNLTLSMI